MTCKHENVTSYYIHAQGTRDYSMWSGCECDQHIKEAAKRKCRDCGDLLPLGPSTDTGPHAEAVAIEIEAARLQSNYAAIGLIMSCQDELLTSQVGYLARCIYTHGTALSADGRMGEGR